MRLYAAEPNFPGPEEPVPQPPQPELPPKEPSEPELPPSDPGRAPFPGPGPTDPEIPPPVSFLRKNKFVTRLQLGNIDAQCGG
jgi:hypothetical protein